MTIKEVCEKYDITSDTLRYYERVGVIPEVSRTKGGIRDFSEEDIKWVENAICMRSAGVPVEMLIEYVKLFREGDSVMHPKFGTGKVVQISGSGSDARILIDFGNNGIRELSLAVAPIVKVEEES